MKLKQLPLLTISAVVFSLTSFHSAEAGLSDQCMPSVQCDNPSSDYYGNNNGEMSCQANIETLDDCPIPPFGYFSAFSCEYGCYVRSRPEFELCPGGVTAEGKCLTTLEIVNEENQTKIWDGIQLTPLGEGGQDGQWQTDDGTNVFRTSGKVGIGLSTFSKDEDHALEIAGSMNFNTNGPIASPLYVDNRRLITHFEDANIAAWGADALKNFFLVPVGIGVVPEDNTLFALERSTSSSEATFNIYNHVESSGTGNNYASFDHAEASNGEAYATAGIATTQSEDAYGLRGGGIVLGDNNLATAYGVYGSANNQSMNCDGACDRAVGVFGTTQSSPNGAGVYGESRDTGVLAIGLPGGGDTAALRVDNQNPNKVAATFECEGTACTSAHFLDGDEVIPGAIGSGMVLIGAPEEQHLAFDNDEIASASGNLGKTLYLNPDSGTVSLVANLNNPTHKFQLPNVNTDLGGRSISAGWETYSDDRVKFNETPLLNGLDSILALEASRYDHYDGTIEDGHVKLGDDYESTIGFIAQDVHQVIPEAANRPEDEANQLWSIDYDKLSPFIVVAIQELKTEKDEEIAALKAQVEMLSKLICTDHPQAEICLQ